MTPDTPTVATLADAIAIAERAIGQAPAGCGVVLTPRVAQLVVEGAANARALDALHMVPVLKSFDSNEPVGAMYVRMDALPPAPDYVFALGYKVDRAQAHKEGPYTLVSIAPTADSAYAALLEQQGHTAAEDAR